MKHGKDERVNDAGNPLGDFIKKSLSEIEAGLPKDYTLASNVEFELSLVNAGGKKGGLDLQVVRLGGDVKKEQTQRIRFSVRSARQTREGYKQAKKTLDYIKKLSYEDRWR